MTIKVPDDCVSGENAAVALSQKAFTTLRKDFRDVSKIYFSPVVALIIAFKAGVHMAFEASRASFSDAKSVVPKQPCP